MKKLLLLGLIATSVMILSGCANAMVTKTTVINRDATGAIISFVETEVVEMKQFLPARNYTPHYVNEPIEDHSAQEISDGE